MSWDGRAFSARRKIVAMIVLLAVIVALFSWTRTSHTFVGGKPSLVSTLYQWLSLCHRWWTVGTRVSTAVYLRVQCGGCRVSWPTPEYDACSSLVLLVSYRRHHLCTVPLYTTLSQERLTLCLLTPSPVSMSLLYRTPTRGCSLSGMSTMPTL